jgi:hypothetical protein
MWMIIFFHNFTIFKDYYTNLLNKQRLIPSGIQHDMEIIFQFVNEFYECLNATFLPELKTKQENWNQMSSPSLNSDQNHINRSAAATNRHRHYDYPDDNDQDRKNIVEIVFRHLGFIKSFENYINKLESFLKHFDYSIYQSKIQILIEDLDKKVSK